MKSVFFITTAVFMACVACSPTTQNDKGKEEKAESSAPKKDKEEFVSFYPSGKLQVNGFLKNGKRVETWSSWFESGEKKSEIYYVDDQKDGHYRVWHKNGQIQISGYYDMGSAVGTWQSFDENGKLISEKKYDN